MTDRSRTDRTGSKYGFYGRLKKDFPSQVIIDLTEVCNLACIHCPHPEFKQSKYYSARYLEPELNEKVIDEIRQWGQESTQYVRYTGEGEPLIHPRGYEMIQHAVDHSGVFVTLTTNGTIMNEKRTRRLLESGVHMIDISIDAFSPEIYAKIRVNGDLEVTRRNVLNLIDWVERTGAGTKVVVSYVEQPQNRHETDAFEKFWKENGATYVVVRRLHSAAGAVADIAGLMRKQNQSIQRRPCVYPWERIVLNPRGHLSFCPADWTHGSTVTDYRETTIKETWQGTFYRALRDAHQNNDYSAHGFCGQCPDWRETRWPSEGRAYADLVQELSGD
jgi:sulfatase maturation enzyme AslB (radical SAM superfamily)